MITFLKWRVPSACLTMLAVISIAFAMLRLAIAGPFNPALAGNPHLPPDVLAKLHGAFDQGQPLLGQFGRYLWNALHLDFGPSMGYRDYDVAEVLFKSLGITVELVVWALVIALAVGVPLGTLAALRRGSALDRLLQTLAAIAATLPLFVIAVMLALLFAITLHWLPAGGWDGGWTRRILPVLCLALPLTATVGRISRRALVSDQASDSSARGGRMIAGLSAALGSLDLLISGALMGEVIVENAFALPGTGRYLVQASLNDDATLLAGALIVYAGLIVTGGLLGELGRLLLDGRGAAGAAASTATRAVGSGRPTGSVPGPAILFSAGLFLAVLLICALGSWLLPLPDPEAPDFDAISAPPSWASGHLLGADNLGRDVLSRLLTGGTHSSLLAAGAVLAAAAILLAWRTIGRYLPAAPPRLGTPGAALPFLVLALVLQGEVVLLPRTIGLACLTWLVLGVIWRTRLPILVEAVLALPVALVGEAYLGYLGVWEGEALVTWGSLFRDGLQDPYSAPWQGLAPAILLVLVGTSLLLVAERVRDAAPREGPAV